MPNQRNVAENIKAINKNELLQKLRTLGDTVSAKITAAAGSTSFLVLNAVIFAGWILINTGQFGQRLVFDEYPFGLLTTAVSLEAIILAVFVLITQNRQSKESDIRAELDYITDLESGVEIDIVITMLERIAAKQNVDVSDLLAQLKTGQKKILREHPLTKDGS
ncbi:MAG: DUF1003 domain-containing protein [Candidatus Saccharimonadales bacterium]